MKPTFDNSEGIAYVWFTSIFLSILVIFGWLVLGSALGSIGSVFNEEFIPDGTLSTQTVETANNALMLWGAFPIFLIIGLAIKSWSAASYSRSTGQAAGGMQSFGSGALIMLLLFATAYILALCGGLIVDKIEAETLDPAHPLGGVTLPAKWQTAQEQSAYFINLVMFFPYFIEVIGGLLFIQSVLQRTAGDSYYGYGY